MPLIHKATHPTEAWRPSSTLAQDDREPSAARPRVWSDAAPLVYAADATITMKGVTVAVCTYQRPESLKRFLETLAQQDRQPDKIIIVDASADDATELMLCQHPNIAQLADRLLYIRVSGRRKGITRQRNCALRQATTDLIAFFDDDIILLPGCLREMERISREADPPIAGVGAFMCNQAWPIEDSWVWRTRRRLKLVPNLQPGRYHRSGISIPWNLISPEEQIEGDWLPGCAMMWHTAIARDTGFYEGFAGYAQGEDLEFSLRARTRGRLLVAGAAQVMHLYEQNGRPDPIKKGYMAIHNRYQIHRRTLPNRTWRDIAWFSYALALDTLLLARYLIVPRQWGAILLQIAGRTRAVYDIMEKRVKRRMRRRAKATRNSGAR